MKKLKFATKVYIAAVLIPALVTLLALAPFPQGIKILGDLVFQERAAVATTPVAGTGTLYVKDTTPTTAVFVDDTGAETTLGAAGAGAVSSVNGQTGAVSLDADDIGTSGTTNKFTTAAEASKLAGIEPGATADQTDAEIETAYNNQVAIIGQAEAEAGVATTRRGWTAERVGQAIAALAPGGGGGDPTYGSDPAASDDAVYVDAVDNLGVGTTTPETRLHISDATDPLITYELGGADGTTGWVPFTNITGWTDSSNAGTDDTAVATYDVPDDANSAYLSLLGVNYGTTIPTTAETYTVSFRFRRFCQTASGRNGQDETIQPMIGSTRTGNNLAETTLYNGTATTVTYTGDWGITWVGSDFDDEFGFAIRVYGYFGNPNVLVSIEYAEVKIDWTGGSKYTTGIDSATGSFQLRDPLSALLDVAPGTGDATFTGTITAAGFFGPGGGLTGILGGGLGSTDNAILRADGTGGSTAQGSEPTISDTGNIVMGSGDLVDGRDVSEDGAKLDGIASGAQVNTVDSVNSQTGAVVLDADDISDTSTSNKYVTAAHLAILSTTSGTNTGDQSFSLSGDLSGTWGGGGSLTATIGSNTVSNSKLAQVPEYTFKGRSSAGTGNTGDIDMATARAMLGVQTADWPGHALTDGATITLNTDNYRNQINTVTLGGNRTLQTSSTTVQTGMRWILIVTQDGTGSRTLTLDPTYFSFSADVPSLTLSTGAGKVDVLAFMYIGSKWALMAVNKGF